MTRLAEFAFRVSSTPKEPSRGFCAVISVRGGKPALCSRPHVQSLLFMGPGARRAHRLRSVASAPPALVSFLPGAALARVLSRLAALLRTLPHFYCIAATNLPSCPASFTCRRNDSASSCSAFPG